MEMEMKVVVVKVVVKVKASDSYQACVQIFWTSYTGGPLDLPDAVWGADAKK